MDGQGDPTEGALLVAARKCGLSSDALEKRLPRVGEVPFSSERKLMSTIHRDTEQQDTPASCSPRARPTCCWRAARSRSSVTDGGR